MVYIAGLAGFICGFLLGQIILLALLKDVSREALLNDRALRWKYGLVNWFVAGVGALAAVQLYRDYLAVE